MTMKIILNKEQIEALVQKIIYNGVSSFALEITDDMVVKDTPYTPRPRLPFGGIYYYINALNIVRTSTELYTDNDDVIYNSGNYYSTREEAEWTAKCNIYTLKLKDAAAKAWHDSGMILDWKNHEQKKYYMTWNHSDNDEERYSMGQHITLVTWIQIPRTIYFPSKFTCQQAYETILGSDLKKYLTQGV